MSWRTLNRNAVLLQELIGKMLQVNAEARYTAQDILSHPWVTVLYSSASMLLKAVPHVLLLLEISFQMMCKSMCTQEDSVVQNNMKMEVTGELKTHFNAALRHSNTTPGVSVIMVSTIQHVMGLRMTSVVWAFLDSLQDVENLIPCNEDGLISVRGCWTFDPAYLISILYSLSDLYINYMTHNYLGIN